MMLSITQSSFVAKKQNDMTVKLNHPHINFSRPTPMSEKEATVSVATVG